MKFTLLTGADPSQLKPGEGMLSGQANLWMTLPDGTRHLVHSDHFSQHKDGSISVHDIIEATIAGRTLWRGTLKNSVFTEIERGKRRP